MRDEHLKQWCALCASVSVMAACASSSGLANAASSTNAWRTECVGRFSFDLPGDAVVAFPHLIEATQGNHAYFFATDAASGASAAPWEHQDQAWSAYQRVNDRGAIFTSNEYTPASFSKLKAAIDGIWSGKKRALVADGDSAQADNIVVEPLVLKDAFAWRFKAAHTRMSQSDTLQAYFVRSGHIFFFQDEDEDPKALIKRVAGVLSDVRAREMFEVPPEPGICLQNAFLPDQGGVKRSVGIPYRLKDHPEVEVFFSDSSPGPLPRANSKRQTAADEVQFFWEARYGGGDKQHKLIHPHIPGVAQFPDVRLGGYKGKSSFVEITHRDNSIDYGYMAYVKGDAGANEDSPTLMLYVIRTASRAKGEPLSKDQIKEMAERIAASVRRRQMAK